MGEYLSKFSDDEADEILSETHPTKPDWIVAHAKATNLAFVEVDRMWTRFMQLGCNSDGILTQDVLRRSEPANDIFTRNILNSMLGTRGQMSFRTFLSVMKWAESAESEEKVKVIFRLLQNGDPVSEDLMFRVLKRTYPNDNEINVKRISNTFTRQLDDKNTGYITEQQFISAVKRLPEGRLQSLLDFHIVPIDLANEAHRMFATPEVSARDPNMRVPTIELLKDVARNVGRGDLAMLANRLGFSEQELHSIEQRHPHDRTYQTEALLKAWKEREGSRAYTGDLKRALDSAGMQDASREISSS